MIKINKFLTGVLMLGILLTSIACNDESVDAAPMPTSEDAAFTYSFDAENPNKVYFTAQTDIPTWYTHWNFGNNSSAEGLEASRVFLKKGDYDVRFKIFTEGGTASTTQSVSIASDYQGPNLVENGELDGDQSWTVLPISDGVTVTFEDGEAFWSGGGWGHVGIYQAIEVEGNNLYQVDMDISGGGLSDCWFEVYVGMVTPTPGVDYTDGGMLLAINTWEGCGNEPFEGLFSEVACSGGDGTFEFDTGGTAYLVIRGGGADYGTKGVVIDNVGIRSLE